MRSIFRVACGLIMLSAMAACAGERNDQAAASGPLTAVDAAPADPSSASSAPPPPVPSSVAPTPSGHFDSSLKAHVDLSFDCTIASDCAIKDVGNCCGSYPACVSVDSPVDAAAVARECADKGLSGICGYPVVEACVCNAGRCEAAPSNGQGSGAVR